jgi:hypothetical protein
MLLDRNLIVDLIALELERETGYRHPSCIVVSLEEIIEEAGEQESKQRTV